jgi:hypothetical protein
MFDRLIQILEKSIEKNGVQPLTNEWLLNILKLHEKHQNFDDMKREEFLNNLAFECEHEDWGDRR